MSQANALIFPSTLIWVLICLTVMGITPIALGLFIGVKNRGVKGFFFCLLAGASSFFIMQIVIRLPILSVLGTLGITGSFAASAPLAYLLVLALTASLFEGAGRLLSIKLLMKDRLWANGAVAHGIGHGGLECLYIGALTQLNNLLFLFMIQSGTIDRLGLPADTVNQIVSQLGAAQPYEFALSLLERLAVLLLQIALSIFAVYAVRYRKWPWLGVMFGIHFLVDFLSPAITLLSPLGSIPALLCSEGVILVFAVFAAILAANLYRKMRQEDQKHKPAPPQLSLERTF